MLANEMQAEVIVCQFHTQAKEALQIFCYHYEMSAPWVANVSLNMAPEWKRLVHIWSQPTQQGQTQETRCLKQSHAEFSLDQLTLRQPGSTQQETFLVVVKHRNINFIILPILSGQLSSVKHMSHYCETGLQNFFILQIAKSIIIRQQLPFS